MNRQEKQARRARKAQARRDRARKSLPSTSPTIDVAPNEDRFRALREEFEKGERAVVADILAQGPAQDQLRELVANAHGFADGGGRLADVPRACKSGCAFCCYTQVQVTVPEVLAIVSALDARSREVALASAREVALRTSGLGWDQRPPTRCPLLGKDNRCSVYESRPLLCRGWNSLDVEPCRAWAEGRESTGAVVELAQLESAQGVVRGLAAGVENAGLDASTCDLATALVIALETPDVVERWAAGERLFAAAAVAEVPRVPRRLRLVTVGTPISKCTTEESR